MFTDEKGPVLVDLGSEDYDQVLVLWERAGLHIRPDGRDAPEVFAQQLASGRQRAVGLRLDGALVGVALLTDDGRKGWINRLAVDPEQRRQGLAGRLLAEAERWFTDVRRLEVWAALVESWNSASLALFEHEGYSRYDVVYVSKRTRPGA